TLPRFRVSLWRSAAKYAACLLKGFEKFVAGGRRILDDCCLFGFGVALFVVAFGAGLLAAFIIVVVTFAGHAGEGADELGSLFVHVGGHELQEVTEVGAEVKATDTDGDLLGTFTLAGLV